MPFHIHVPKPLHGWKAFFNEIMVIVIGVLIALALEAGVEWLHWRHKAEDGQARLRTELLQNGAFMAEQVMVEPCVKAQIERLEARLSKSKGVLEPAPMIQFAVGDTPLRIPGRPWTAQTWEALQQDGTTNHMDGDVQATLGKVYEIVDRLRNDNTVSQDRAGSLKLLGYPIELTPEIRADLLRELWSQLRRSQAGARNSAQSLRLYRQIAFAPGFDQINASQEALTPGRKQSMRAVQFCREQGLPLTDWRAEVEQAQY